MKTRNLIMVVMGLMLICLAGSVSALTNVNACGTLSTPGETYVLTQDVSSTGTCFTIDANRITLDCQGHTITGPDQGQSEWLDGIFFASKTGVQIKNCEVSKFFYGVLIIGSSNSTLTNNIISSNIDTGIDIQGSSNSALIDNDASSNGDAGIYLYSSSNNILANNIANSNAYYGIYLLTNSNNNVLTNNTANLQQEGIRIIDTFNNIFTSNTVNSNEYGIHLFGSSSNNILTSNKLNNNSNGIYIYTSNNNTISSNTINSSKYNGVIVNTGSYNRLVNNRIEGSGNGLRLYSDSNYNTILNNTANSNAVGVYLSSSSNNILVSNTVSSSSNVGILLFSNSNNNTLRSNVANGPNQNMGIYLSVNSNYNTITGNSANSNNIGIYLDSDSNYNTIIDNTANSNTESGIQLYYSTKNNVLTDNIANSNGEAGIRLISGSNNQFTSNNVNSNKYGFYVAQSSSNNIFTNNVVNSNTGYGMILIGGSSNTFANNSASLNAYGIFLQSTSGNTITGNNLISNHYEGIHLLLSSDTAITKNNVYQNTQNNLFSDSAIELSSGSEGNFWGRTSAPYFIAGTDSNAANVVDSHPYSSNNAWLNNLSPVFEETVSVSGGTVESVNSVIDIPAGALPEETVISVVENSSEGSFEVGGKHATTLLQFEFNPPNLVFDEPVTITFDYSAVADTIRNEKNIDIYWYNPSTDKWEKQKAVCDSSLNTCTIQTTHFSIWAIVEEPSLWDIIQSAVGPTGETCNGKDDNCDGTIDDGIANIITDLFGYGNVGECRTQTQSCISGSMQISQNAIGPTTEICDNKDNNCNSLTDSADSALVIEGCELQAGVCAGSQHTTAQCSNGAWQQCTASEYGSNYGEETCPDNGIDNNCDGEAVVDCAALCDKDGDGYKPDGAPWYCLWPFYLDGDCDEFNALIHAGAADAICNGIDENCNGIADDGYVPATTTCGIGACARTGQMICNGGQESDTCVSGTSSAETCDNVDNNCDGVIDESLTQSCYTGPLGTAGVGICHVGAKTCAAGVWGTCSGEVTPQTEIQCNNIDENCNGMADDCPIVDQDGDGVLDNVDQCLTVKGTADKNGCPYADITKVDLQIVDQMKSGVCGYDAKGKPLPECKTKPAGVQVKIFDRDNADFVSLYNKRPDKKILDTIFESNVGLVGSCVTNSSGSCIAGEDHPGKFLVIAKYVDGTNSVYSGKHKNFKDKVVKQFKEENDDDDVDDIAVKYTILTKNLHFIKTIKKDGKVKYEAGALTVVSGSQLNILYPEYTLWEDTVELYPFVMSSADTWTTDVCMQVPTGYKITGVLDETGMVVGTSECVQSFVAGQTKVILFQVTDIGSPEPDVSLSIGTTHNGKKTNSNIKVSGIRTKTKVVSDKALKDRVKVVKDKLAKKIKVK